MFAYICSTARDKKLVWMSSGGTIGAELEKKSSKHNLTSPKVIL